MKNYVWISIYVGIAASAMALSAYAFTTFATKSEVSDIKKDISTQYQDINRKLERIEDKLEKNWRNNGWDR